MQLTQEARLPLGWWGAAWTTWPGWVGLLLPAISPARAPLEGRKSSILAQHPAGMSFLLGVRALGNTASLDRKIGLCALFSVGH